MVTAGCSAPLVASKPLCARVERDRRADGQVSVGPLLTVIKVPNGGSSALLAHEQDSVVRVVRELIGPHGIVERGPDVASRWCRSGDRMVDTLLLAFGHKEPVSTDHDAVGPDRPLSAVPFTGSKATPAKGADPRRDRPHEV